MLGFEEDLKSFVSTIDLKKDSISTEETTKISLILPFIQLLGYDITNLSEVQAEYAADMGVKKNEKIDLAIMMDDNPEIIIECKLFNSVLAHDQISQLYRYFNVTSCKLCILTNGDNYKIYTDICQANTMDDRPFLDIILSMITDKWIHKLIIFNGKTFDLIG